MLYANPTPTVDTLIEIDSADGPAVVLIRRRNPPEGWAIPGGFVDEGETVEAAAVREALEETGLHVTLDALLHVYSDPARDPRQHTLSVAFAARAAPGATPTAADDAAEVRLVPLSELASVLSSPRPKIAGLPIAFDHAQILADWLRFRRDGRRPDVGGRPAPE